MSNFLDYQNNLQFARVCFEYINEQFTSEFMSDDDDDEMTSLDKHDKKQDAFLEHYYETLDWCISYQLEPALISIVTEYGFDKAITVYRNEYGNDVEIKLIYLAYYVMNEIIRENFEF
jgi:hypothetical protein